MPTASSTGGFGELRLLLFDVGQAGFHLANLSTELVGFAFDRLRDGGRIVLRRRQDGRRRYDRYRLRRRRAVGGNVLRRRDRREHRRRTRGDGRRSDAQANHLLRQLTEAEVRQSHVGPGAALAHGHGQFLRRVDRQAVDADDDRFQRQAGLLRRRTGLHFDDQRAASVRQVQRTLQLGHDRHGANAQQRLARPARRPTASYRESDFGGDDGIGSGSVAGPGVGSTAELDVESCTGPERSAARTNPGRNARRAVDVIGGVAPSGVRRPNVPKRRCSGGGRLVRRTSMRLHIVAATNDERHFVSGRSTGHAGCAMSSTLFVVLSVDARDDVARTQARGLCGPAGDDVDQANAAGLPLPFSSAITPR